MRQWDAHILNAHTPLHWAILIPHTEHEARQQRNEVEQEPPQSHHQTRRAGARVWEKQSNSQHVSYSTVYFKDSYR